MATQNKNPITSFFNFCIRILRKCNPHKTKKYYESIPPEERENELKRWFKRRTGLTLNLENPQTFNEKVQWLKLHDVLPIKTRLADKFTVRDYVREKIGEKYLVKQLGVWEKFEDIDFDQLPQRFALKTTHGSGYNIIVKDKSNLDKADARKKFTKWLKKKFEYQAGFEMHYQGITPRIIAEEFLDVDENSDYDWSVFCANGEPKFIRAVFGGAHSEDHGTRVFYSLDWKKLPFTELRDKVPQNEIPKPENLEELLHIAKALGGEFIHVWVDVFRLRDGSWKFGEMTFTRASGLMRVTPPEYNKWIGDQIKLPIEKISGEK